MIFKSHLEMCWNIKANFADPLQYRHRPLVENPCYYSATAARFNCHVKFSFTFLMFGIFFISENTFFNILDPENTQDKSGIDSRGFKLLHNRFRKVSICSHVVVNRNNLLSVCVQNMWVNKRVEEVEERECVCRHWVKGQSSSRSTDDAVSHPQEHTGRMVDWTLCDSWSQSSSPPLIPLELCLHSASQQQGPVRAALHTSCCCFSLCGSSGHSSASVHTHCPLHTQLHKDDFHLLREEDISVSRDSLHQLWVSDAAHPVERAAGTSVLFRGGAASSLLHVHVLEWNEHAKS